MAGVALRSAGLNHHYPFRRNHMAKSDNLFMTPVVEVRWFRLDEAVDLYRPKPNQKEFTVDLILDESVAEEKAFLESVEQHYLDEHGKNSRRSQYAISLKPDKDTGKMKLSMKVYSWQEKTNPTEWSPGPTIMDAAKNPWPFGRKVGNGSKCRIQYSVYAWGGDNGSGITLQPHVVQVVEWAEMEEKAQGDVSAFEPVPGGFVVDQAEEIVNCPLPGA